MKLRFAIAVYAVALAVNAAAEETSTPQQTEQAQPPAEQAEATQPATETAPDMKALSYTLGYRFGQGLSRSDVKLDTDALLDAIKDGLAGKEPRYSAAEMQAAVQAERQARQQERLAMAQKNKAAGQEYMKEYKSKEGVQELPSGIMYRVLQEGSGKQPQPTDTVTVNYRGQLIDGKEFDSSYGRGQPTTFQLNRVIKGWQEVLPLMKQGAKWEVVIPPSLAYGARGAGPVIGPNETLVFEIELLEVAAKEDKAK